MKLTAAIVAAGTGASLDVAASWVDGLQAACDRWKIQTTQAVAAFLANVGVETGGLKDFEENLYYSSPDRLAAVWPSRYAVDPKARPLVGNATAQRLAKNPQALANNVYANRLGNGPEASGDGWKFRGQGPIQLTGRANITAAAAGTGIDFVGNPEYLKQPGEGSMSAAWFFVTKGCLDAITAGDFSKVVAIINGQPPCDANHGPLRKQRFYECMSAIAKSPAQ